MRSCDPQELFTFRSRKCREQAVPSRSESVVWATVLAVCCLISGIQPYPPRAVADAGTKEPSARAHTRTVPSPSPSTPHTKTSFCSLAGSRIKAASLNAVLGSWTSNGLRPPSLCTVLLWFCAPILTGERNSGVTSQG